MKIPPGLEAALKAMAERRRPVPTEVQIFREAVNFHESAQRCFEQRKGEDGGYAFSFAAGVVGLAFASELYLKALYHIETGKTRQGHRLNVLFVSLRPETQQLVRRRYNQRRKGSGSDLDRDLATFANAFVEWRYIYEMKTGELDVVGLGQLASSLYETCLKVRPELPVAGYTHSRVTSAAQGIPLFPNFDPIPPPPWEDAG